MSSAREFRDMDRNALLNLVIEKNKRIQDLERLVEDQKRLRLQDSNQVEEKAARIKEWVTNKLKELENQNKQLRDQNRKQKEAVETLSIKLASLSPISSPRKRNNPNLDTVHFIDQTVPTSPIETIDVTHSLKTRRPQLKKSIKQTISSSLEDDNQNLRITLNSSLCTPPFSVKTNQHDNSNADSVSCISIGDHSSNHGALPRQESPLYDSVNIEPANSEFNQNSLKNNNKYAQQDKIVRESNAEPQPPPPPLHQSDRWELQLYNLAEKTFSTLMRDCTDEDPSQQNIADANETDKDAAASGSRKSSTSLKHDIISVVRPSFTTIDGNQVVDNLCGNAERNSGPYEDYNCGSDSHNNCHRSSNDQSSQSSNHQNITKTHSEILNNQPECIEQKLVTQNLFDSPMRSRSGKDSILRTQSVRRNPAPEKLYDFISADLVKRGYLVKHGALRSHNRWFVLRNFHLYSYKREAEETAKTTPTMTLKLESSFQIQVSNQSSDGFPFKICYHDKTLLLIAESAQTRDEWIKILTVTVNMSDIESDALTKHSSSYEGVLSVTRHGHTKRCHAILVSHIVFFLKSPIDPTPMSYLSVKGAKIREITDSHDYDPEEEEFLKLRNNKLQDCSLAIYPKFSLNTDPVYLTLGSQQDTDGWFYTLSNASGIDQSNGTQFERTLTQLMITNSMAARKTLSNFVTSDHVSACLWRDPVMLYSDRPVIQPLTSLPNETLKIEAIELFKSILLFTQVPIEPVAIDYHVSLLQNCLGRILKHPELRNEFFAQLIKQSTYVLHRCYSSKLSSSGSSGCSSINQRSSLNSLSPSSSECQFITDLQLLGSISNERSKRHDLSSTVSQLNSSRDKNETSPSPDEVNPPSRSELLQVMQILAVAVSLNLPRGRLRWWLIDHLRKFRNPETNIGKYALFTLKSIERTIANGTRDNVPSRTEVMSILLRNPYDHSTPHSLPVSFADGSYLVVGADGSTTVEEFMASMSERMNVRHSLASDFYLFADDPCEARDLHILEPQRKVLDVVGWWEQTFRQNNSGRYQNTRVIKLICKKRLLLKMEDGETDQERLLIVHQVNQEIVSHKIPLDEVLALELGAIMTQLTFGDFEKSKDPNMIRCILDKISSSFLPGWSSHPNDSDTNHKLAAQVIDHWRNISGRNAQDCIRVYLNCIRRLKLGEQ